MFTLLARDWWIQLVRGIVALALGLTALFLPEVSLAAAVLLVAVFAVADGVMTIAAGIAWRGEGGRWWSMLVLGLLQVALGLVTLFWPDVTVVVLVWIFAAWCVVSGALTVLGGKRLRHAVPGEWVFVLLGAVTVVFGVVLALAPVDGALALTRLLGAVGVVIGVGLVVVAFRLRRVRDAVTR